MPNMAEPMFVITSNTRVPGYHGQAPGRVEMDRHDAPLQATREYYQRPAILHATGYSRTGRALNPTPGMAWGALNGDIDPLPDLRAYSHPVVWLDRNRNVQLKSDPSFTVQSQLFRRAPSLPYAPTFRAPTMADVQRHLGGVMYGG